MAINNKNLPLIKKIKTNYFLGFIFFTATAVSFFVCTNFSNIGTDGVFYAGMAKSLAEGNGLTVFGVPHTIYSPLLSIFISVLYMPGLPLDAAAHIAVIFFALAGIIGAYFLGRKLHSEPVGLLSALFLGTSGMYIWSAGVSTSPQFAAGFFALAATLCLLDIEKNPKKRSTALVVTAGACVGLAYLARPEYFFLIFPVMLWLGAVLWQNPGKKNALLTLMAVFASFIVVVSPYLVYLHNTLGYWTISGRGSELAYIVSTADYEAVDGAAGAGVSTVVAPPVLSGGAIATALRDIPLLMKRLADGLVNTEHVFLTLFGFLGVSFLALGLRHLILEKKRRNLGLFAAFLSPVALIAFAQGGSPNYLVQYFYLFTPIMAIGLVEAVKEVSAKYSLKQCSERILFGILIFIFSAYLLLPLVQNVLFLPKDYREIEYKELGLWMKDNIPNITRETVVSRKPESTFYAGSLWSVVPNATSTEALCALMKKRGQRYVVADDRSLPASRPELTDLLKPEKVKDNFTLKHTEDYYGKRAILYEIRETCVVSNQSRP